MHRGPPDAANGISCIGTRDSYTHAYFYDMSITEEINDGVNTPLDKSPFDDGGDDPLGLIRRCGALCPEEKFTENNKRKDKRERVVVCVGRCPSLHL